MAGIRWSDLHRREPTPSAPPAGGLLQWVARRLTAWEDWLTFVITVLVFLAVALSIQNASGVENMPPLVLVGFLALVVGMFLARSSLNQLLAHLVGLALGAAVVLWQALTVVEGGSLGARVDDLYLRMSHFFDVARDGLISNDTLPFVILVVGLTWLGTYFFAWSVFRWHNGWLGIIPGGAGLFTTFFYQHTQESGSARDFSFLFVLFAFGSLLLVMRMNLLRRMRQWQRQGTPYPEFISLSFLHLTSWAALGLLLMAWLVPAGGEAGPITAVWDQVTRPFQSLSSDLGRLFVHVQTRQVRPIHGFEDILPFKGSIPLRDRVVLEVKTEEVPLLSPFLFLYGAAYTRYTPVGWLMGDRVSVEVSALPPADLAQLLESNPTTTKRRPVETEVTVVGSRRSVLFSLGQPLASTVAGVYDLLKLSAGSSRGSPVPEATLLFLNGLALQSKGTLASGTAYRVLGTLPDVSASDLRAASGVYPFWVRQNYLPLPSELPERVRQLALQVTAEAPTAYDKALSLERFLRQNYPFTVKVPDVPVGRDATDFFLFESRQGYFDYYASAMAVMLRAVGIPSRLVVGFVLDERDRLDERFIVRDRHAYAWAEAYFPGVGWVQFNPTPDRPALGGVTAPDPLELPLPDDLPLPGLEEIPSDGFTASSGPAPAAAREGGGPRLALWIALAVLAAFVLAAATGRFAWERSVAGLPYSQQVWEKTMRLASWARARRRPSQTPREYMQEVSRLAPEVEGSEMLAEAYGHSRFGRRTLSAEERERLRQIWQRLRNRLLLRILARRK